MFWLLESSNGFIWCHIHTLPNRYNAAPGMVISYTTSNRKDVRISPSDYCILLVSCSGYPQKKGQNTFGITRFLVLCQSWWFIKDIVKPYTLWGRILCADVSEMLRHGGPSTNILEYKDISLVTNIRIWFF